MQIQMSLKCSWSAVITRLVYPGLPGNICRCYAPLSWSQLTAYRMMVKRCSHSSSKKATIPPEWKSVLKLKSPKFDFDYLCDPNNTLQIHEDIQHRKGVGDIHKLLDLWKRKQQETDEKKIEELKAEIIAAALAIPNTSHPNTPIGSEEVAETVDVFGKKPDFDFKPKTVEELGESLGMLRTAHVVQSTGPKTYYFTEGLAQLEQALIKYTLRELKYRGFELISVPDLLNQEIIIGCGLNVSEDNNMVYRLDKNPNICLAGTSEMALAGYCHNVTFDYAELPKKLAAVSRCYRVETSHAEEEKGIYRVHQFTKVEMFGVAGRDSPEEADSLLTELLDIEKYLFQRLGLHCRILEMPTQELGAPAHRKYDIEAWMPGKQFWGEISSASNCTDFQSRRLNICYRSTQEDLRHCATVNGTAMAIPRTIMAICENFQRKDGTIALPEVLWWLMDGQRTLKKTDKYNSITFIKDQKLKR